MLIKRTSETCGQYEAVQQKYNHNPRKREVEKMRRQKNIQQMKELRKNPPEQTNVKETAVYLKNNSE